MFKRIILSSIVVMLIMASATAQSVKPSGTFKTAQKEYKSLRFLQAIRLLKTELAAHPDNIEAQEMIANSYRSVKDYDNAVQSYEVLTRAPIIKPEWALHYAEVLANKEQYESSEQWYRKYVELINKGNTGISFAKSSQVASFLKARKQWQVSYTNINTAASEYSPIYYKGGLMFSSNRNMQGISKRVFGWDETPFSDLYYVSNLGDIKMLNPDSVKDVLGKETKNAVRKFYKENDDDTYPTSNDSKIIASFNPKLLNDTLGRYLSSEVAVKSVPGKVNSKYHEGPATLLPDGSLIFTRNNYIKGSYGKSNEGINKLKLYTAKAPEWTEIEAFPYNNDQYSVGHPTVNKAGTLLIFVSDMPGGYGGTDLYYSNRQTINDQWEKPVNMGSVINTPGNEMFPGIYQDSILFFSSTGHPGLGGLDIFHIGLDQVKPTHNPVNLGAPINSSVDDFGIIRSDDGTLGYFTSNRKGSDDIYSFNYHAPKIMLAGIVVDSLSGQPIAGSQVALQPNSVATGLTSDVTGKFSSTLMPDLKYAIIAHKEMFSEASGLVDTKGIVTDTTLTITLKLLAQKGPLFASGFKCDSVRKALTLGKIYYDLDKSFIRKDAIDPLTNIIDILKAHPDLQVMAASFCDSRASKGYNVGLSLRRSSSAKAYLAAHGISSERVKISYYGETHLVNECADDVPCSEAEQQLNRRTEFYLIKDGKRISDIDCDALKAEFSK